VKEQSHKDEMSAAIRGDFRRLRERGVAATLAPRDEDRAEPDPVDALPAPEPTALELHVESHVEAEAEAAPEPDREPEIEAEPEADEPAARPGFLARLLGR
jgi:hypothetical protein